MNRMLSRLSTVCKLLNAEDVQYVIVGGFAAALHGLVRATQDVDVLIEPTVENAARALRALSQLPFGVAHELVAEDVATRSVTMVGDTPNVDLLTIAWSVRYADAKSTMLIAQVDGVAVPYPDLDTLIRSKRTNRHRDLGDIEELEAIREMGREQ